MKIGVAAKKIKPMAPWKDFSGKDIHEGDIIIHPSGETGKVIYYPERPEPSDGWKVRYREGDYSRLCLQIGGKGMGVVKKNNSTQHTSAKGRG